MTAKNIENKLVSVEYVHGCDNPDFDARTEKVIVQNAADIPSAGEGRRYSCNGAVPEMCAGCKGYYAEITKVEYLDTNGSANEWDWRDLDPFQDRREVGATYRPEKVFSDSSKIEYMPVNKETKEEEEEEEFPDWNFHPQNIRTGGTD